MKRGLVTAWLGWLACSFAEGLIAFWDVESVLITGPIILLLGLTTIAFSFAVRYRRLLWLGVANCAICLFFFGLVQVFNWSPVDAAEPFCCLGFAYAFMTLPWVIQVTRSAPRDHDLWSCVQCGYLLYGLHEPRCPECGTPFDPTLLQETPPPDRTEQLSRPRRWR